MAFFSSMSSSVGRKNKDGGDQQSSSPGYKHELTGYWNLSAALTIVLPMFLCLVARLVSPREGGDGGEGKGGGWFHWWNGDGENGGGGAEGTWWWGDRPEEQRHEGVAQCFAYVWTLLLFTIIVWRGNRVLENDRDRRALFSALVVFGNLSFVCWILVGSMSVSESLRRWRKRTQSKRQSSRKSYP